jgi:hypothetical protein
MMTSPRNLIDSNRCSAMTVAELMVAVAAGGLLLAVVAALSIYGLKSFVAVGNYTDLDEKGRAAMDEISCDLRECTDLEEYDYSTNAPWFRFNNQVTGIKVTVGWDSVTRTLTTKKVSGTNTIVKTNLTGCDYWHYEFFQQTPLTNIVNGFAAYEAGKNKVKLVNMSWSCSRSLFGTKWNTESVQTAKIVLRNRPTVP